MAMALAAQAMPSRMADLPDPFSPARNVTGLVNSSGVFAREATAGTLNGYVLTRLSSLGDASLTDRK